MASTAATLRQTRFSGSSTGRESVEASLAAESGLVSLENVDVPTEVRPGENIPIAVDVRNDALTVGATDPDWCISPQILGGYRLEIVARLDGIEQDRIRRCVAQRSVRDVQLQVRAPTTEGTVDLTIEVEGGNSGHFQDDIQRTIVVTEDAQPQPCPPGFERDPDTGDCVPAGGGDGDGDGDGFLDDAERALTLLVVAVALIAFVGVAN